MYVDAENRFSNAQTVTTGSGSGSAPGVVSTNILNLGTERRPGTGQPVYIVVIVTTALESSGSNDAMDINLYSDSDSAWGSATFRQRVGTLPAVSAAGTVIIGTINPGILNEQYIGLYYISQTSDAFTAAGITSFLALDVDAWVAYAKGYTIA